MGVHQGAWDGNFVANQRREEPNAHDIMQLPPPHRSDARYGTYINGLFSIDSAITAANSDL